MSPANLFRLGGLAAILAGVLRTGASFLPYSEPTVPQEMLYLVIDVLLLFGLLAVYIYQSAEAGLSGFFGFVLAMIGTAIITGPDGTLGGVGMYETGAMMISVGLVLLSIGSWKAARLPRYVLSLWILSTVVGIGGFLAGADSVTFLIAGLAFGVGFIGAGIRIWSDPALSIKSRL